MRMKGWERMSMQRYYAGQWCFQGRYTPNVHCFCYHQKWRKAFQLLFCTTWVYNSRIKQICSSYIHNYILKASSGKNHCSPNVASPGCFQAQLAMHDFTAASGWGYHPKLSIPPIPIVNRSYKVLSNQMRTASKWDDAWLTQGNPCNTRHNHLWAVEALLALVELAALH